MKSKLSIPHSAPFISKEDMIAVNRVLATGMIARGSENDALEKEFCSFTGKAFASTTTSGSSALIVALNALKIAKNDEVIVPTYVCKSVLHAIRSVGAKEVLCDIGDSWVIDFVSVRSKISTKTKAIIAVHIFGVFVDCKELASLGVPIIEDCCQSLDRMGGRLLTSLSGDISIYSLHATKCLPAGEGGLIATNRKDLAESIEQFREQNKNYFNLSDLNAALARSQLSNYNETLGRREEIAGQYFSLLPVECTEPLFNLKEKSMFFRFPLRWTKEIPQTINWFNSRGIQVRRGVDELLHRLIGIEDKAFPNSAMAWETTLSIPIMPQLSTKQINFISDQITSYLDI